MCFFTFSCKCNVAENGHISVEYMISTAAGDPIVNACVCVCVCVILSDTVCGCLDLPLNHTLSDGKLGDGLGTRLRIYHLVIQYTMQVLGKFHQEHHMKLVPI